MSTFDKIIIDDEPLYIRGLEHHGGGYTDDGIVDRVISSNTIQSALKPIVKLSKMVTNELKKINPDETELTIQLSVGIEEGKLFFALADVSAEAQIAIKYTWKKESNDSTI